MTSRLKALGRIAALYQLREYADGVTLDQARAALHDVESMIRARADAANRLESAGYEALREGDQAEWQLDQSQIQFMQWNSGTLDEIRQVRDVAMREAAATYQASRMQLETIESVLSEAKMSAEREQERAVQRAADDRYLSRRRWETHGEQRRTTRAGRVAAEADLRFEQTI